MIKNLNTEHLIIIVCGFLFNLVLIIFFSKQSGDGEMFLRVAENIYYNKCISISLPSTAKCIPHWGGNQGPLYPIFISAIWNIYKSNLLVLFVQQVILSLSFLRFFYVINKINFFKLKNLLIFILLLSPLSFGWSRFILTESLSISLSLLLFSELILCNYSKKIKIFRLSIIFCFGFFLRYDFLLWSIPIIIIVYYSIGFYQTILKAFYCILIFIILLSLWSYRNFSQGLNLIPGGEFNSQYITLEENQPSYKGYLKWIETWSWHNYMYAPAVYPLSGNNYKDIIINNSAFDNKIEKQRVYNIINYLKKNNGKRYPKFIDDEFLKLSIDRVNSNKTREYITLPIKRSLFMIFNPLTSMGLPSDISSNEKSLFIKSNYQNKIIIIKNNFSSISFKVINFSYRILLYSLFLYLLIKINKLDKLDKILLITTLIYFFVRIILFSQVYFTATRHLLQPLIMMEMSVIVIFLKNNFFNNYKN